MWHCTSISGSRCLRMTSGYSSGQVDTSQLGLLNHMRPIPVPARSKGWVCGRSIAGIVCSNPAGGLDVSLSCECCVLSGRGLRVGLITRPKESYRVWCVWAWSWILDNEEDLSRRGLGCLSRVSVVCCQVEVSALGWSLFQRSPTECGVSECDHESSIMRRTCHAGGLDVSHLWVLCVVRYRSLQWADHSSKGVLPSVVCLSVIMNPR